MVKAWGGRRTETSRKSPGEARILPVLEQLATEGATLRPTGTGDYEILASGEGSSLTLSGTIVAALKARDLIRSHSRTKSELILSDAGRAFLQRLRARTEPFREQHYLPGTRSFGESEGTAPVNAGETPLGWLARRKGRDGLPFLTKDEVEAGERLRMDFTYASMSPRVTQAWAVPTGAGQRGYRAEAEPRDAQLAAKERFVRALDAVGPGLSDVLVAVCCHLEGLELAERTFDWPVRSGKVVLKIALQRLAAHYGLGPVGGGPKSRSWRAEP